MLLGTSLIYCISDILDGTVVQDDVFSIVTTNTFDISSHVEVYEWYCTSVIQHNITNDPRNKLNQFTEKEVLSLFRDLVYSGVLLNAPNARQFNLPALRLNRTGLHWYSLCTMPDHMDPAVKEAWIYFKSVEALCNPGDK